MQIASRTRAWAEAQNSPHPVQISSCAAFSVDTHPCEAHLADLAALLERTAA
jgi:hypothetical protein